MQFENLAGLGPFILSGITVLILRGHFVGIGAILGKRSARQICAGILAVASSLMHWLTKWEGVTMTV
jgi:hypothetical protein